MPDLPKVAYLTSVYPRASDSFIRGEIEELRTLGVAVETVSIRRPGEQHLVTGALREEADRTHYLLDGSTSGLLGGALRMMITRPIGLLRSARLLFSTHPAGIVNRCKQLAYLVEAAALVRWLEQRGIRHVHNHIAENSATVAMAASTISRITYSMTVHGPGIFFHPRSWALDEKISHSSFTACITKFCLSQCMIFARPEASGKLREIHCGVGSDFLDSDPTPPPAEPRFTCVGRLCPEKGHLLLVEAVKRLVNEGIPIEMHLIGDGEAREDIEAFVQRSGLEKNVILHGWASSDTIRRQLLSSRALVLASFAEGLPVVLMEAMAMRRPVITSRIAGIPELVHHGRHGWLVTPADVDSLCDALREASQCDPEGIARMGTAGHDAVQQQHCRRREASKLKRCFEAIAAGRPLPSQRDLDNNGQVISEDSPLEQDHPALAHASAVSAH